MIVYDAITKTVSEVPDKPTPEITEPKTPTIEERVVAVETKTATIEETLDAIFGGTT